MIQRGASDPSLVSILSCSSKYMSLIILQTYWKVGERDPSSSFILDSELIVQMFLYSGRIQVLWRL